MGILDAYRLKKSLAVVCSARVATSPETMRAISRLKSVGQNAIPKLIDGLTQAQSPELLTDVLASLLDNTTFQLFTKYLASLDSRLLNGVIKAFTKSTAYDPNRLLSLFADSRMSKNELGQILSHHAERLNFKTLLSFLDGADKDSRSVLLRLIDQLACEDAIPHLILQARHEDPATRFSMARILTRFNTEAVRETLLELLSDPHKRIRQVALSGLAEMNAPLDVQPVCRMLRDTDAMIQLKAKEILIKQAVPQTSHYLVDLLQDESEPVRRRAVEVLNAIGDTQSIRVLLEALKDKDGQVRARTVATLGAVGGPKLLDTVLPLLKDGDEYVRGSTIEIINITKDRRAFDDLVEALEDRNISVKTRAAEALAALGDRRALTPLLRLLEQGPEVSALAIRSLIALKDRQVVRPLLSQLPHPDVLISKEILQALGTLTDGEHAREVWQTLMTMRDDPDPELRTLANTAANTVISRYGNQIVGGEALPDTRSAAFQAPSMLFNGDEPPSLDAIVQEPPIIVPEAPVIMPDPPEGVLDASKLEPGQLLEERYRVIRCVGQGGFGTVILVEDTMVGEEIILKFLNHQVAMDDNMIKRFIQELRFARRIAHKNVIRIYDFLTLGKAYAISMEYFPSHNLGEELRNGTPLSIKRGLKIVWDICLGIGGAHQVGVVHRDLKPPNILIDDQNAVKVVDFGLAALSNAQSRLTRTGVLLGTPTYMAPEQVRNRTIDVRTDIYSLGVIMYEMFTGRPPYVADDPMSVLFQHVEGKPTPPRDIQQDLSPAIESIILKAMQSDPAKRFQTMEALRKSIVALSKPAREVRD